MARPNPNDFRVLPPNDEDLIPLYIGSDVSKPFWIKWGVVRQILTPILPSGTAAWGSIATGTGVASQTDLITYLVANYYPLLSNPAGYVTATQLSTTLLGYVTTAALSAALANYVPTSRTLTINGVTYDLSADRSWTVSGGSAAWGSIGAGTGVGSQADLVAYLVANYYPLSSNPAGYITLAALANYVQNSRQIATTNSLTGGGDLSADRTLQLVNDNASPGNLKYYGTDSSGTKGFNDFPSGRYAVILQLMNGTAVTGTLLSVISLSGLVPAGTNTTGDILRVTIRTSKVGTGAGYTIRLYSNTTNSLSGASLLGFTTSVGSPATIRQIPLYRDLAIKDELTNTQVYPTTIAAVQDVGASATSYSIVAVDHTVDQYYFVALQNASNLDSTVVDFIRIERT
jgi:hypothetical protein